MSNTEAGRSFAGGLEASRQEHIRISILVPSRGRAGQLVGMARSATALAENPDRVELLVFADDDDQETQEACRQESMICLTGARNSMGFYLRRLFDISRGDVIVLLNDDVVVRTRGWDTRLVELFEGNALPVLAYPNDLFKKKQLATFPILSRQMFRAVFSECMDSYKGAFIDTHLLDFFLRLQKARQGSIRYLPDVVFEHMHYRLKKSPFDSTYADRDRFGDDENFLLLARQRKALAKALIDPGSVRNAQESSRPGDVRTRGGYCRHVLSGLLLDGDLPWNWRIRMTSHFLMRYVYRRLFAAG